MPLTSIRPALSCMAVAACAAVAGCGSLDGMSRGITGRITPYKVEVVQGNFVSSEQVAQLVESDPARFSPALLQLLDSGGYGKTEFAALLAACDALVSSRGHRPLASYNDPSPRRSGGIGRRVGLKHR